MNQPLSGIESLLVIAGYLVGIILLYRLVYFYFERKEKRRLKAVERKFEDVEKTLDDLESRIDETGSDLQPIFKQALKGIRKTAEIQKSEDEKS